MGHVRVRVAYHSPMSPERSGIADYSALLLPALRKHVEVEVVPRGRLATDNAELLVDAAVSGLGLVCLLDFMVARDVASGDLRPVLDDAEPEQRSLYALQPLHRHPSAKVTAFVDYLIGVLKPRR